MLGWENHPSALIRKVHGGLLDQIALRANVERQAVQGDRNRFEVELHHFECVRNGFARSLARGANSIECAIENLLAIIGPMGDTDTRRHRVCLFYHWRYTILPMVSLHRPITMRRIEVACHHVGLEWIINCRESIAANRLPRTLCCYYLLERYWLMRTSIAAVLLNLVCSIAIAQTGPEVKFPRAGFAIQHLNQGLADDVAFESMKMLLPRKGGFAGNVNIQHQPYPGSLEDYAKLSRAQFEAAKLTVLTETVDKTSYTSESKGEIGGYKLHFYCRGIKVGDNIILATATSLENQWQVEKEILAPAVDSLRSMHTRNAVED